MHRAPAPQQAPATKRRLSNLALLSGVGGAVCLLGGLFLLLVAGLTLAAVGIGAAVATDQDANVVVTILGFLLAFGGLVLGRELLQDVADLAALPGLFIAATLVVAVVAHVRVARDPGTKGVGCVAFAYVFGLLAAFGLAFVIHADAELPRVDDVVPAPSGSAPEPPPAPAPSQAPPAR